MARFGVGEVIGSAFRTVFGNFSTFLATQGVVLAAWLVVTLLFQLLVLNVGMAAIVLAIASGDLGQALAALGPLIAGSLALLVLGIVAQTASTGLGIVAADAALRGERVGFGQAWAAFRPRFGNLLGTTLLVILVFVGLIVAGALGAILILPFIAGIVAAFYFLVRWAVAFPVSVLERQGAAANLGRASALTNGSRGSVFGAFLVLFLVLLVPTIFVAGASYAMMPSPALEAGPDAAALDPADLQPSVGTQVVQWAMNGVLQVLATFLGTTLMVILYRRLLPPPPVPEPPAPTEPAPTY